MNESNETGTSRWASGVTTVRPPRASTAVPAPIRTVLFSHDSFGFLLVVLGALTIARLSASLVSTVDLFPDEAQYWAWSRDWAFGYFSKPPLLAWIIGLATATCGNAEPCVRAPAPLFYFGTCALTYVIGRMLYDARTAFWAGLTVAFGIGTAFSARIISTDVPLLFFWALALVFYLKLLERSDTKYAVALGLCLGLGLLAKYAMGRARAISSLTPITLFPIRIRDPVLFVSECPFPERLRKFYENVELIDQIISPAGPRSSRWHSAFRLAGRRAPVEPLTSCVSAAN